MVLEFLEVVIKCIKKNNIFLHFLPVFWPNFNMEFSQSSAYVGSFLILFCEVMGAQRVPNEGPKAPPMPSAGARRKGL